MSAGAERGRRGGAPCAHGAWEPLVPRAALAAARVTRADRSWKVARPVAALFVDVEGCTRLCEDLPPRAMNALIEAYFARYLDAVRAAGGEVTEVLGDGLLALFEGDQPATLARRALGAARAIREATRALNRRRRRHDPVTVNLGLHVGRALVGLTRLRARSGERWIYSASGPVTNIAARLCALARHGQLLTTRATAELLPPDTACRPRGRRRLKNVAAPVEVVEVVTDHQAPARPEARRAADG